MTEVDVIYREEFLKLKAERDNLIEEKRRLKMALEILREMATQKPEMSLVGAAATVLGLLRPLTPEDIKRGQQIAKAALLPSEVKTDGQ